MLKILLTKSIRRGTRRKNNVSIERETKVGHPPSCRKNGIDITTPDDPPPPLHACLCNLLSLRVAQLNRDHQVGQTAIGIVNAEKAKAELAAAAARIPRRRCEGGELANQHSTFTREEHTFDTSMLLNELQQQELKQTKTTQLQQDFPVMSVLSPEMLQRLSCVQKLTRKEKKKLALIEKQFSLTALATYTASEDDSKRSRPLKKSTSSLSVTDSEVLPPSPPETDPSPLHQPSALFVSMCLIQIAHVHTCLNKCRCLILP